MNVLEKFEIILKSGGVVEFDMSIFEVDQDKQMVNLTKIANACGKDLHDWKKRNESGIIAIANRIYKKNTQTDGSRFDINQPLTAIDGIYENKRGGNDSGTWGHRKVAILFAQWISPDFQAWCIDVLDELFQKGKVELKPMSFEEMTLQVMSGLQAKVAEQQKVIEQKDVVINKQEKKIQKRDEYIEEVQPIILSHEQYANADGMYDMEAVAKIVGIGRNTMFAKLRESGYLMSNNSPKQQWVNAKWFDVILVLIKNGTASVPKTVVTQKGLMNIVRLFVTPPPIDPEMAALIVYDED